MSQDDMSQDDSRRLSEQGRYWYRQGKAVTHVQFFTNLVGLQKPRANSEVESTPIPIHALQPLNDVDDHAPIAGTTAFIRAKRELIKEGWPIEQVLGSEELDINLLSPKGASEIQNPHLSNLTVGQWVGNIFERIKDIKTPEKLAMTLLGVLFLRVSTAKHPHEFPLNKCSGLFCHPWTFTKSSLSGCGPLRSRRLSRIRNG